jgi:thymidylate synthase
MMIILKILKIQFEREPRAFPTFNTVRKVTDMSDFKTEGFIVENYTPDGTIAMQMSV